MENNINELVMQFDPNTIEHLGIQMYSTLPPVIAELISNAYDADAKKVKIELEDSNPNNKKISITDTGHGMSFEDINKKFLLIGRNRRRDENSQKSLSGNRNVIGKKGIGKLSFFGIAENIKVSTVHNNKLNTFVLDWNKLREAGENGENYKPEIIENERSVQLPNGTTIILTGIKRKSAFDRYQIAYSLSKTFSVFDEDDFNVEIIYNGNTDDPLKVTNNLKYDNITEFFHWDFPIEGIDREYEHWNKITGKIITGKDTITSSMKGVALFSRKKLVNDHEFYDDKATSFGYSYITGWLNIDFIDDWGKDVISTNRRSLNWEDEDCARLRQYLNKVIAYVYSQYRKKIEESKKNEIKEKTNIDIESWVTALPAHEKKLAKNLVKSIISSDGLTIEKSSELISFVKDSFQFEAFKEFASELDKVETIDPAKLIHLMKEWELIESREMYKLAIGRIQTIEKFKKLIDSNAYEVKEIHPFFEKFPWILDPRINMFRHELQYAQILKENYSDEKLEEKNRRIDFLCTSVSNHKFIVELKRPKHKITKEDIEQAKDYRSFIEEKIPNDRFSPNKVIVYVVGGGISDDRLTKEEITTQQQADKVYVKTFVQLLEDARNYHCEFLSKYENMITNNNV
jgi:hypothetical protein